MTTSAKQNLLAIPVLLVIALLILFIKRDLDAPVVYNSNSATIQSGETVCAFVDTKEGKKPCDAFSVEERSQMEQRWAN